MARILIVDNEAADVGGLISLLGDIELGGVDHVESAEDALTSIKDALESGQPYRALIVDLHLGGGSEVDIDGDEFLYILDGNLEHVVSSYHPTKRISLKSSSFFDRLRKLKGAREDIIDLLESIFGSPDKYGGFVEQLSKQPPVKIIFAGSYSHGQYPEECISEIVIKDPTDSRCEVEVVHALMRCGVIPQGDRVNRILSERNPEHFYRYRDPLFRDMVDRDRE